MVNRKNLNSFSVFSSFYIHVLIFIIFSSVCIFSSCNKNKEEQLQAGNEIETTLSVESTIDTETDTSSSEESENTVTEANSTVPFTTIHITMAQTTTETVIETATTPAIEMTSAPETEMATATKMSAAPETTAATAEQKSDKTDSLFKSYLTGLGCTAEEQRQRPVAVMINNIKAAQPTIGVSKADIMYECLVEGGQTRLMMVLADFESVPVYGSIRSSRDYYVDLAQIHDAIYVHAGGTDMAYDTLYERNIARLDGVNMYFPNTFYRDKERLKTKALEHTLMATGKGIKIGIGEQGYRTNFKSAYNGTFSFYDTFTDVKGSGAAEYVCVPFSSSFKPEFKYNATEKRYYRWQFGVRHVDGGNNVALTYENVIVLFAQYRDLGHANGYLACDFTGSGYGFYITNGTYKVIQWQKDNRQSILNLLEADGTKLTLNPGKSYIGITSTSYSNSVTIR